jgi:hypothetical protein
MVGASAAPLIADGALAAQLATQRAALFDSVQALPLDDPHEQVAAARAIIDAPCPGLNMLILHPAQDKAELRALAPD